MSSSTLCLLVYTYTYFVVVVVVATCVFICIGSTVDALHFIFHLQYTCRVLCLLLPRWFGQKKPSPSVEKVPPYIIPIQSSASRANSFLFDCGSKNMKFGFLFSFFFPRSEIHCRASATEAPVCAGK